MCFICSDSINMKCQFKIQEEANNEFTERVLDNKITARLKKIFNNKMYLNSILIL